MAARNRTGIWIIVASVVVLGFVGMLFLNEATVETKIQDGMSAEEALTVVQSSCLASNEAVQRLLREKSGDAEVRAASSQCEIDAQTALDRIPSAAWANSHCRAVIETQRDLARWNLSDGIEFAMRPASSTPMSETDNAAALRGMALFGMAEYHTNMCQHQGAVG